MGISPAFRNRRLTWTGGLLLLMSFIPPSQKKIKLWLVGDSTMSDKEVRAYPETGWGMPFEHFFDSSVIVDNRAVNGRSTKSFINEGRWAKVMEDLSEGDYVFIQFGHNDEYKEKVGRYTTPDEFKANLTRYVIDTRSRKAIPILLTPVARRVFDSAGHIRETHPVYADAVRSVAEQLHVPLIDLDEKSKALLQQFGPEDSKWLYNYLQPGEHPNYPEGHKDDTHFNELGARRMAEIVLSAIKDLHLGLADHIRPPLATATATGANGVLRPAGIAGPGGRYDVVVAADGSGNFTAVQAALDSVPVDNRQPFRIYIKNGIYREKLHLDSTKDHVEMTGEDRFNTILTYDDHPGMVNPHGDSVNTRNSYSFIIRGADFSARNLCFRNDAGFTAGQAVALEVQGDRAQFTDCRIIGNQDILFLNSEHSRQYYNRCYIEGTTDFIFGAATAWFNQCHIHSKKNSHVTAASTPKDHPYGFVFYDCALTGDSSLHNASLGRPWRPFASVTYIHCYIDRHIRPEGWSNWNNTDSYKTARFSEYADYGPGSNIQTRVPWSHQLTDEAVRPYTMTTVLDGWTPAETR